MDLWGAGSRSSGVQPNQSSPAENRLLNGGDAISSESRRIAPNRAWSLSLVDASCLALE